MTSSRRRRFLLVLAFLGCGLAAVSLIFLVPALRMPYQAPLARMYRTEADLASLAKAVEFYRQQTGVYPPPGIEGLQAATSRLSGRYGFFPDGPASDAWGHPFVYVAHTAYDQPQWGAVRCGDAFCAPGGFQIYSLGADGLTGADAASDDITGWSANRPWRDHYKSLNKDFMQSGRF